MESGTRYSISFKDGQGEHHELEVSEQLFIEFRQMERRNRNLQQWNQRHREFRNILNEMYSADVSVKIKSAYRARFQQGKFMGTYAPYGYIKDPADHNHLLIDDKVAHVVREIFDLASAGNGLGKIRKHINSQHILRPAAYAAEQGATGYERYFEGNEKNRYIWSENSVRGILRSPIYAGNLAGYKRIAANMKSRKRPSKLPEEWEVIPDTHEGIVTQEEFDTVQQLMTSRRREQNAGGFENIFAGVIKCADCGYLNEKDNSVIDDEPEQNGEPPEKKSADRER